MALHIQMSEEAEKELKRSALRNQLSSIAVSLAVMLLGGGALFFAVILIVQEAPAVFVSYVPPAENLPPSSSPTTQELSSKAATPTNTVSPTVIVSTGAAPVQMAAVEIDAAEVEMDAGIDLAMGMDSDLGDSLGDAGGGLGSSSPGGSALVGTYYDLKRTRSGANSKDLSFNGNGVPHEQRGALAKIYYDFTRTWSPGVLDRFYKAPTQLYASNFYMPRCNATYGPVAFGLDTKKFKPAAWVVVYRGKVRAPKSGKFRFVGTGDDLLCVRFNRKMVLEAGYAIPSKFKQLEAGCLEMADNMDTGKEYIANIKAGKDPDHRNYEYIPLPDGWAWNRVGGLTAGTVFEVSEGQVYPIEILVSEGPGGAFGFALLIEDLTDNPQSKKPAAERVYDLFRTNFSLPDEAKIKEMLNPPGGDNYLMDGDLHCPPYNADCPIWVAVP